MIKNTSTNFNQTHSAAKGDGKLPCIRCDGIAIAQRRQVPLYPLQWREFSDTSRAYRRTKLSIQRLVPSLPPVISADKWHNLQFA